MTLLLMTVIESEDRWADIQLINSILNKGNFYFGS